MSDHGSFWGWLGTDDGDLPIHLPIGVNAAGQGPESGAAAHHFVCWCGDVECPLTHALALADARARADERERVGRVWAKREDLLLGDIEVARADERAALNGKLLRLYTQNTHAEAVAARLVEVVCEQDDLIQIVGVDATNHRAAAADMRRERDAARAEVVALRKQEWAEPYRREVLADLRAKVSAQWVFGYDPDQVERIVGEAVLALIEEAGR